LTNNVTFRTSGKLVAKHVTGDLGQKGQTVFSQLPPGNYNLREEVLTTEVTSYGFCGQDPNNPTLKVVGTNINFNVLEGITIYCTWFNVPDDVTATTGAILIQKYVCDAGTYPANYDWYNGCGLFTTGAKFTVSVWNGTKYVPKTTGLTNEDGLLRFSRLQPGTYQIKEVGSDWCHAESDSVNTKGDVIVRANQRATIWISNCVDARNPPNTGTGSTAGISSPGGGNSALLFGLTLPLLALMAYGRRRRRLVA
jgi:Prealbumin-like fold domain